MKKKKKILFVYNPIAGDPQNPNARLEQATGALLKQGFRVKVALVKPKEEATKVTRRALKKGYRRFAVLGGDGTIEAVARELVGTDAVLGLFDGGTENNLSHSLGIPTDLDAAAQIMRSGVERRLDTGLIQVKGGQKRAFFEFAATGLMADLFADGQQFYRRHYSKIGAAISQFIHFEPPCITLELTGEKASETGGDGQRIEQVAPLVTVSNTPVTGLGFLVAPDASLEDGLLDVSFYQGMSKVGVLAYFEEISHEKGAGDERVQRYRAGKIKIHADPEQLTIADGAILGYGDVKIKVKPASLRVMTGERLGLARDA